MKVSVKEIPANKKWKQAEFYFERKAIGEGLNKIMSLVFSSMKTCFESFLISIS